MSSAIRIGIVTVSDRASAGLYADEGGPAIEAYFKRARCPVTGSPSPASSPMTAR